MKIDGPSIKETRDAAKAERAAARRDTSAGSRPNGGDRVSVSSTADRMNETVASVQRAAAGAPPERVAEVREAVRRGSYPIDIQRLARAILADERG